MLLAVEVMGCGVGLFVRGSMGSDPFSTLNLGVASKLGISFGLWQAIFNCVLLVFILFLDRSMLGPGTVANMFLVGFTSDLLQKLLDLFLPSSSQLSFWARLILTLLGVVFLLLGCSCYVTSRLGMAPYDCLSYLVPARTRISFRLWRILSDVTCVLVGFLCGASVGIGTLLMAFGTGPLLPILNRYVASPLLKLPPPDKNISPTEQ